MSECYDREGNPISNAVREALYANKEYRTIRKKELPGRATIEARWLGIKGQGFQVGAIPEGQIVTRGYFFETEEEALAKYQELVAEWAPKRDLDLFTTESNRIEGIRRPPTPEEIQAHETFLALPAITVQDLEHFVQTIANRPLRRNPGQNVMVGNHLPPEGGPDVEAMLKALLIQINAYELTPYEAHVRYELLHPFMDGNGRSGRVLWAWMMQRDGLDPFALPFLHRFYYQTLDTARKHD